MAEVVAAGRRGGVALQQKGLEPVETGVILFNLAAQRIVQVQTPIVRCCGATEAGFQRQA